MVKLALTSVTVAIATAGDATSLLQVFAGVRQSNGQRILSAVAEEGKDSICVEAAIGDVSPIAGSFAAKTNQQAVEVAAGSVAAEAGSFCVPKQDVLLMQRTYGLNTARDFDTALGSKQVKTTTTTTTRDHENYDFAGDTKKKVSVMVNQCPNVNIGLMQTMDATVTEKKEKKKLNDQTADQARVCACRSFMKSRVGVDLVGLDDILKPKIEKFVANNQPGVEPANLLQIARDLDAALGTKKRKQKATTTTTTTQAELMTTEEVTALTAACTSADQLKNWTVVAKLINDPDIVSLYQASNITAGWEHCDKSWVVHGACGPFVETTTTTTTTTTTESLGSRLTANFAAQNVMPQTTNEAMESEDWAEVGWEESRGEESRGCHPKFGRRFQRNGMMSPTLMYDNTGHIAGMQFAINTETFPLYPDSNLKDADSAVSTGLAPTRGNYAFTTYFSDPSKICSATAADHGAGSIGDRLWVANASAPGGHEAIPLNSDLGVPDGYVAGGCAAAGVFFPNSPGMGTHYWRKLHAEVPCNELGPMFLMYSGGRLVAMGINFVGSDNQVPTNGNKRPVELGKGQLGPPGAEMWEFARQPFSPYFFQKHQNPKCMPNINMFDSSLAEGTATIATMHVFFSDPQVITCP